MLILAAGRCCVECWPRPCGALGLRAGTPVVLPEALAGEVDEMVGRFAGHMGEGLLAASVAIGLDVLGQMMDAEARVLAGPKGRHDPARSHVRHGTEAGSVVLGGRRVPVRRPRVRSADDTSEAALETYQVAHASDLLAHHMGLCAVKWGVGCSGMF